MRHPEADSFYDLLGVCRDASPAEIRAAFLKMAERHHPDRNLDDPEADERFKRIRRIYEVLRDPMLRAAYDDHPHHFRLSDADVLGRDRGPIVPHPMPMRPATGGWSESAAGYAPSGAWPTWRIDRGRIRDSRLAFAAAVATMVTLAAVCVLLVRANGRSGSSGGHSVAAENSSGVEPLPSEMTPLTSPLDQVFSSVQDLRADSANPSSETMPADADTPTKGEALPRRPMQLPPFNVIDELNLPFPGWPLIIPPVDPPRFMPPRDRDVEAFELQPTTAELLEARMNIGGSDWTAPSTVTYPAPSAANMPGRLPSATHPLPAPTTHVTPPATRELESGWSSPIAQPWNAADAGRALHSYSDPASPPIRGAPVAAMPELPADLPPVITPPSPFVRPIVRQLVSGLPGLPAPPGGSVENSSSYTTSYPTSGIPSWRKRPIGGELESRIDAATVPRWAPAGGIPSLTAASVLPPRSGRLGIGTRNFVPRERSIDALPTSPTAPPAWSGLPPSGLPAPGLPSMEPGPLP